MREHKRRHDDVHFPGQGKGNRADPKRLPIRPRAELVPYNESDRKDQRRTRHDIENDTGLSIEDQIHLEVTGHLPEDF